MKALKDIPFDLIKILRKQSSKAKSSLAEYEDDGRTIINSNSRKNMHRSKSRKANRHASGNNERKEKAQKHLGIEINSALDRMQELEA